MGVLAWIIAGLIAGWLAARITGAPRGLFRNIAVGLAGAIVGGVLFEAIGLAPAVGFLGSLVSATVGAIAFLLVWQAIRGA